MRRLRLGLGLSGLMAMVIVAGLGAGTVSAAEEAPSVTAWANAPGAITVAWSHSGEDTYWYEIEEGAEGHVIFRTQGASGTDTVTGLQPDTTYTFRVCAVYASDEGCSDWVSARTLPAEQPSPPPPGAPPALDAPVLTADSNHPRYIHLSWSGVDPWAITDARLFRDGAVIYDAHTYGDYLSEYRDLVRMNTLYIYQLCIWRYDQEACSDPLVAKAEPGLPELNPLTVDADGVHITWLTNDFGEDHLELERLEADRTWHTIRDDLPPGTDAVVDPQPVGVPILYFYRVCVVNQWGRWCSARVEGRPDLKLDGPAGTLPPQVTDPRVQLHP